MRQFAFFICLVLFCFVCLWYLLSYLHMYVYVLSLTTKIVKSPRPFSKAFTSHLSVARESVLSKLCVLKPEQSIAEPNHYSFIHSLIHSWNKQLLSTNHVLGIGDTKINTHNSSPTAASILVGKINTGRQYPAVGYNDKRYIVKTAWNSRWNTHVIPSPSPLKLLAWCEAQFLWLSKVPLEWSRDSWSRDTGQRGSDGVCMLSSTAWVLMGRSSHLNL